MKRIISSNTILLFIILIFMAIVISFPRWIMFFYPLPHQEVVISLAQENKVDPLLVFAIIRAESKYKIDAYSPAGARGLMQIMPDTATWIAERMGIKDFETEKLFEPEINIAMGCWYINNLMQQFDNRLPVMLAAYNAGSGNVKKWLNNEQWNGSVDSLENIPFTETREYVKNVINNYEAYKAIYN